jgi:hypothetical protein
MSSVVCHLESTANSSETVELEDSFVSHPGVKEFGFVNLLVSLMMFGHRRTKLTKPDLSPASIDLTSPICSRLFCIRQLASYCLLQDLLAYRDGVLRDRSALKNLQDDSSFGGFDNLLMLGSRTKRLNVSSGEK